MPVDYDQLAASIMRGSTSSSVSATARNATPVAAPKFTLDVNNIGGGEDLGGGLGLSSIGDFGKTALTGVLDILDTPRAAVTSALKEVSDFSQGEGFSFDDWVSQTRDNYGFSDFLDSELELGTKTRVAAGFVGDVLLDPLTYLGGASAVTRLGRTGIARKAFAMGDNELGQRVLQKGLSSASADDLSRISSFMGTTGTSNELRKGVFFRVPFAGKEVQLTSFGSGQQTFDRVASVSRNAFYKHAPGIRAALGGQYTGLKGQLILGTAEEAATAFKALDVFQVSSGRAKTFTDDLYREFDSLARGFDAQGVDGVTLFRALGGDAEATASLGTEWTAVLRGHANALVDKANDAAGQPWLQSREDWQPWAAGPDLADYVGRSGREMTPGSAAGFEKRAGLVAGGRFMGEALVSAAEHPQGFDVRRQVEDILAKSAADNGEDHVLQLFSNNWFEAMPAYLRELGQATRFRMIEQGLLNNGVAVSQWAKAHDSKAFDEAVSQAGGRDVIESMKLDIARDAADSETASQRALETLAADATGTTIDVDARRLAAQRVLVSSRTELDQLKARRFRLEVDRLDPGEVAELNEITERIDDVLGRVARAESDVASFGGDLPSGLGRLRVVADDGISVDGGVLQAGGDVWVEAGSSGFGTTLRLSSDGAGVRVAARSPVVLDGPLSDLTGDVVEHALRSPEVASKLVRDIRRGGSSQLGGNVSGALTRGLEGIGVYGKITKKDIGNYLQGLVLDMNAGDDMLAAVRKNADKLGTTEALDGDALTELTIQAVGSMGGNTRRLVDRSFRDKLSGYGHDAIMYRNNDRWEAVALNDEQLLAAADDLPPNWHEPVTEHMTALRDRAQQLRAATDDSVHALTHDVRQHTVDPLVLASSRDANLVRMDALDGDDAESLLRRLAEEDYEAAVQFAQRTDIDPDMAQAYANAANWNAQANKLAADVKARSARLGQTELTDDEMVAALKRDDFQKTINVGLQDGFSQLSKQSNAPTDVFEALQAGSKIFSNDKSGLLKSWDAATRLFKTYAVLTPGFHSRNFMGGVFNNSLGGVDLQTYGKFMPIYKDYAKALDAGRTSTQALEAITRKHGRKSQFSAFTEAIENGAVGGGQVTELDEVFQRQTGVSQSLPRRAVKVAIDNPLTRGNFKLGTKVEDTLRGVMFMDRKLKGGSVEEALDDVFKYHFDYDDLSGFERGVARRIVPFYTWSRKNLPLQLESMATNPKIYNRFQHLKRNVEIASEEEETVPQYVDEALHIRLPFKFAGGRAFILPDLPFKELTKTVDPGEIFGSVNPLIKTPLERKFNTKSFQNIPFSADPQPIPQSWGPQAIGPALGAVGLAVEVDGEWYARDKDLYTIEQALPLLSRSRRLLPSEGDEAFNDRVTSTWINFLFGPGLFTNTDRQIQNELYSRDIQARDETAYQRALSQLGAEEQQFDISEFLALKESQ